MTPRRPLRESDVFQTSNVSGINYRVWRGPAFWAQLTSLIMDMLVTSLIAIEVRVLFVLQQQQQQQITTTCSTSDNEPFSAEHEVIVNPFFRVNSIHSPMLSPVRPERPPRRGAPPPETQETSLTIMATRPKVLATTAEANLGVPPLTSGTSSPSPSNATNQYVNSKEVRQLKKLMFLSRQSDSRSRGETGTLVGTSYCNPLFSEHESKGESTSQC